MLVAIKGCNDSVFHKHVVFLNYEQGSSTYVCLDCTEEFIEYEDCCSGG
jgi:hypothetical protein